MGKEQLLAMVTNGVLGMIGGATRYIFIIMQGQKKFNFFRMSGMVFISITIAVAVGDLIPPNWFIHGRNGLMVFVGIVAFEVMREVIERLPKIITDKIIKK